MSRRVSLALVALILLSAGATAEEEAAKPPRKPGTPLKLLVVFSRHQGEKKIASVPYTLSVNASGASTRLRMGIQVPLKYEGKEGSGNVVYKNVGNNLDCNAETLDEGRYKVACTLEQSSVYSNGEHRPPASAGGETSLLPPVLRNFSSEATLILRDGQTAQHTVATDPVSGEVLKVDVTLNVVK